MHVDTYRINTARVFLYKHTWIRRMDSEMPIPILISYNQQSTGTKTIFELLCSKLN